METTETPHTQLKRTPPQKKDLFKKTHFPVETLNFGGTWSVHARNYGRAEALGDTMVDGSKFWGALRGVDAYPRSQAEQVAEMGRMAGMEPKSITIVDLVRVFYKIFQYPNFDMEYRLEL